MSANSTVSSQAIDPAGRTSPRIWAAIAILFAGVLMVGVAGCFLVGVLSVVSIQTQAAFVMDGQAIPLDADHIPSNDARVLLTACYIASAASGLCAILMLAVGMKWLLRILQTP